MRGGKSIWLVAGGALLVAIIEPTWQWWYQGQLTKLAEGQHGPTAFMVGLLTAMSPIQQFLYGMAFGMILAFTIGYWPQIVETFQRSRLWTVSVLWLWWQTRPGKRRLAFGGVWLETNQYSKRVDAGVLADMWTVEVQWWPRGDFYCHYVSTGAISIARSNRNNTERASVNYEIWGRRKFWATLRHWRDTDYIGQRQRLLELLG